MSGRRYVVALAIVGFAVPAAGAALDASELARCAAIAGGNERLACYDALAEATVPGTRIAPATVTAPAAGPAAAMPGTAEGSAAVPAVRTAAASPAAAAPPARSANPDDPANFGLTPHQLKEAPAGPDSVKAIVSQLTEDRLNNVYLVLDNGQTWNFTDPNPRVRPGDTVTIKRAALGSFLMTTPSRRSYRVQRLN